MLVLLPAEITAASRVGSKTKHLKKLLEHGLKVPNFVAVAAQEIIGLVDAQGAFISQEVEKVAQEIVEKLPAAAYAVRSSALIEDSEISSFAGQFTTSLNVPPLGIAGAIVEVVKQAQEFLQGDLVNFSLLIQEFIEPDYAGIIFTRNPLGKREMIIEYHAGRGEEVVGGKVKPERKEFYWNDRIFSRKTETTDSSKNLIPPGVDQALQVAQDIERYFGFPQDIEWCSKDENWFWLQTRPITTISEETYQKLVYLDSNLPQDKKFFYQKTELSEIAPRPTPLTLSLLKQIYATNGPVDQVYKKYGVAYHSRDFFKIIGNELFVDREEEIKTLLPSHSFFSAPSEIKPRWTSLCGSFVTIKNLFALSRLDTGRYEEVFFRLKTSLQKNDEEDNLAEFIKNVLEEYQVVFETNLLTGKAVQKIAGLLRKEPISLGAVLKWGVQLVDQKKYELEIAKTPYYGNSLEISDVSKFLYQEAVEYIPDPAGELWWNTLSVFKKKMFEKPLQEAVLWSRFREFGRWFIVKKMNKLRELVFEYAAKNNFVKQEHVYFAALHELVGGGVFEKECIQRKHEYDRYQGASFPTVLTSELSAPDAAKPQGVSPGTARGILVTEEMLVKKEHNKFPLILYTPVLSPQLTVYFDRIVGIVSQSGGLLSHLAIMAREYKLPVVVQVSCDSAGLQIGDEVEIDGERGLVEKVFSKY